MSYPQLNSKNNGLGLLFKTMLWRLFCFLLFVAAGNKDWNGLKPKRVGSTFSCFDAVSTKNTKQFIKGCSFIKWFIR